MNKCGICHEIIKDDNPNNTPNLYKHDRDCPKHPGAIARRNYALLIAAAILTASKQAWPCDDAQKLLKRIEETEK
jgi:hypothetical protein